MKDNEGGIVDGEGEKDIAIQGGEFELECRGAQTTEDTTEEFVTQEEVHALVAEEVKSGPPAISLLL